MKLFCFLFLTCVAVARQPNELWTPPGYVYEPLVTSPLPHTYIDPEALPVSHDWRNVNGTNMMTTDLNQHIPVYCGSCWAHAALSSLGDRIKIQNKGLGREVIPSVQVMINCGDAGSCNGGDSGQANAWVEKNSIPDVTCQQYQAVNGKCTDVTTCETCGHNGCTAIKNYPHITVTEHGTVHGDTNLMSEIYARGPVSCYIDAGPLEDYTGGICPYNGASGTNHAIQINGWGVENGKNYWIGRNSWGTYWGEEGWFRIVRGGNYNPGTCFWAVPGKILEY